MRPKAADIDAYIARFPGSTRVLLEQVRATIHKAAPGAEEGIAYAIPAFKLNGPLIYFAGFSGHIGLYPLPKGDAALLKAIAPYVAGKGTLRFALDAPLPLKLIGRVVARRAQENADRKRTARR